MKNSVDSPFGFDKSAEIASRLVVLAETGSTNDDAVAAIRASDESAPDFSVFVTENQTAGRGRLGRTWVATSGKALAISVVVKPNALFERPDALAWLPLMAGAAMTCTVQSELDKQPPVAVEDVVDEADAGRFATLKWPNDVLIDGYKVSGILTELVADQRAVVIGAGINVSLDEHDLPTLTSTSLKLVTGRAPVLDDLLARYLSELRDRYDRFVTANGDAAASGLLQEVQELCATIGQQVRIDLPGDQQLHGQAITVDESGRIVVIDSSGTRHIVAAGDVTHLRVEP